MTAMLTLTGCGDGVVQPTVQDVLLTRVEPVRLVFIVDPSFEPVFSVAAEDFAGRVSALSGGELMVTVERTTGASQALASGEIQLAFIDSRADNDFCKYFPVVSMPFLYIDYQNFTMTVNSDSVISMISEDTVDRHGARPIAGMYRPGKQLVTAWQASDYEVFNKSVFALEPGSGVATGFGSMGVRIVEPGSRDQLVSGFADGSVAGTELTLAEISEMPWQEGRYYVTMTYHDLAPVWLFASDKTLCELTPRQKAAITESAAYLFNIIDSSFLQEEENLRTALIERQQFFFSNDFYIVRDDLLNSMQYMSDDLIGAPEKYMLDIVRG